MKVKEEWKPIKEYAGLYEVSNYGRVRSLKLHPKILKGRLHRGGYLQVNFCKSGVIKNKYIHRLVAQAFIPNPCNLPEVNHLDENKTNNSIDNLEWCTHKQNNNYGTKNVRIAEKLSFEVMCVETNKTYKSVNEAFRETGISDGNIVSVCNGKRKTAGGFHWKYIGGGRHKG